MVAPNDVVMLVAFQSPVGQQGVAYNRWTD